MCLMVEERPLTLRISIQINVYTSMSIDTNVLSKGANPIRRSDVSRRSFCQVVDDLRLLILRTTTHFYP
jgi:hypothetical protein